MSNGMGVEKFVKMTRLAPFVNCSQLKKVSWAKFKELSPILTAHGASYHMKEKIFRAYVQSVLTYGTETWAMQAENLHFAIAWREQSV